MLGEPICVSTLSSHCRGPFRWSSIQQGVLVTVCLLVGQNQMLVTNKRKKQAAAAAAAAAVVSITDSKGNWKAKPFST